MNPAAIKAARDQQLAAQVHQNDLEDIDRKSMPQGAISVIEQSVKAHMDAGQTALENSFGAADPATRSEGTSWHLLQMSNDTLNRCVSRVFSAFMSDNEHRRGLKSMVRQ